MPALIPLHLDFGKGNTPESVVIRLPEADVQRLARHAEAARMSVGDWLKQELTRSIDHLHPSTSALPASSTETPKPAR